MVDNNKIPVEVKKPTETVYELKDEYKIPTFEEFMKTYEGSVNYADLSGSSVGEAKGYGPCSSSSCECYVSQGFISLYLGCPATGCGGDGYAHQWIHGGGCSGPMYIHRDADLKCMRCNTRDYITDWVFKCRNYEKHQGKYLSTTEDDCIEALSAVMRLYPNKPAAVKRIARQIVDKLMERGGF